jgi:hypothetical protein
MFTRQPASRSNDQIRGPGVPGRGIDRDGPGSESATGVLGRAPEEWADDDRSRSARGQARRRGGQVSRVVGLEAVEEVRREGRLEEERPSAAAKRGSRRRRMRGARPWAQRRTGRRRPARTWPATARDGRGPLSHRRSPRRRSAARMPTARFPIHRDDARARGPRAPSPRDARSHEPGPRREPTGSPAQPNRARLDATGSSGASGQCTRGKDDGEWRARRGTGCPGGCARRRP